MARILLAGGSLAALSGIALTLPVLLSQSEGNGLTAQGVGILAVALGMIVCGLAAVLMGYGRRRDAPPLPSGVRAALLANGLIVAFFALELSDRLVRQNGQVIYWSTFLLLPALLLFIGLLTARRWAWSVARGAACLTALWFLGFAVILPFAPLQTNGVPTPWYGRVYMIGVSLAFAGILAGAFRSLGSPEARYFFGAAEKAVA